MRGSEIHLEGAVVTIDAAGCQTAIVHLLALKGNQGTLHRKVKAAFDAADRGAFLPEVEDRCRAQWRPPRVSLVRVQAERSSRPADAAALLALVRGHWRGPSGRGNGLHRTLDVQFREDTAACAPETRPPSWASSDGPP